jgi:hypothetical protein
VLSSISANGDALALASEGVRALAGWERDGGTLWASDPTRGTVVLFDRLAIVVRLQSPGHGVTENNHYKSDGCSLDAEDDPRPARQDLPSL